MKSILLSLLFVSTVCFAYSQNGAPTFIGARSAAMGQTGLVFKDVNAAFSNQAGLAHIQNLSFLVTAEQRFLNSPIGSYLGAVAYPNEFGTFGLTFNYFGIDAFNEQKIGFAYARQLFDNFSIGAQFDFLNTQIQDYGSTNAITFELGCLINILPDLTFGFHLYNPVQVELIEGESLPAVYKAGIGYQPSKKALVTIEVEKDIDYNARFRAGLEYQFLDTFFLRVGAATEPVLASIGIGTKLKNGLALDIGSTYHQYLGISPSVGVIYNVSKE